MTTAAYTNYFRQAAKSNKTLSHETPAERNSFRRMNIEEILSAQKTDLIDICMVLENFNKRGFDMLSDNKRKVITGAFLIIKQTKIGDFDQEEAALDLTEKVAEQILAKITNDFVKYRHNKNHPWPIKGFDLNSISQMPVFKIFSNWTGWRTEFTIDQTFINNLQLDNADWFSDTKFIL